MSDLVVSFGPSRSPHYGRAVAIARRCADVEELAGGRISARIHLAGRLAFLGALRLLHATSRWRGTEVELDGEPEIPWNVSAMAGCAATQLAVFGACGFRYWGGVPARCRCCPLFDPQRAVTDMAESAAAAPAVTVLVLDLIEPQND